MQRTAMLALAALALTGCGGATSPADLDVDGSYRLTNIDGTPVPIFAGIVTAGRDSQYIVGGTYSLARGLNGQNVAHLALDYENRWAGVATYRTSLASSGRYEVQARGLRVVTDRQGVSAPETLYFDPDGRRFRLSFVRLYAAGPAHTEMWFERLP